MYRVAGRVTDDNVILRMRIACWIHKVTDTHSAYVILKVFPLQNGCTNAPHSILNVLLTSTSYIFERVIGDLVYTEL